MLRLLAKAQSIKLTVPLPWFSIPPPSDSFPVSPSAIVKPEIVMFALLPPMEKTRGAPLAETVVRFAPLPMIDILVLIVS